MANILTNTSGRELRKPNPDIGYRITVGRMTFLSRKIYNCFVYRAQLAGVDGKGNLPYPVVWDMAEVGIEANDFWWIPMSDLVDDVAAEMGDNGRIRRYLRDLMSVLVERTYAGWEIQHIIESARIINTVSPEIGKRGGKLLVGWNFPKGIEKKILAPDQYTRMSIFFQGQLRTEASLVLYEICKQYATSPGKVTGRMPWQDWRARLTGDESDVAYKDFKRRTLTTAIKEVNSVTDIHCTIVEHKKPGTKAVEALQFVVEQKPQGLLELSDCPAIDTKMLQAMESIGISPSVAEKFLSDHGEEKVKATLAYMNERLTAQPAITAPGAYFRKALLEDYAAGAAKGKQAKEAVKAAKAQKVSEELQSRKDAMANDLHKEMGDSATKARESRIRAKAKAAFDEMDTNTRQVLEDEYCNSIAPMLAKDAKAMFGAENWTTGQATAKLFLAWLAGKLGISE